MTFRRAGDLRTHKFRAHSAPVQCEICLKMLANPKSLNTHMQTAHLHDKHFKFRCDICDYGYVDENDLVLHKELHQSSDLPFKCVLCDSDITNCVDLKKHVKFNHTDFQPLLCDFCPKVFSSTKTFKEHRKLHTDRDKLPACPVCNLVCTTKAKLAQHMNIHDDQLKFICNVCGKGYKDRRTLNYHLKSHDNILLHACRLCEKRFNSASKLKLHENIHSGKKLFHCQCGKGFISKNNLKQHHKHCSGGTLPLVKKKQRISSAGNYKREAEELIEVHIEEYNNFQQQSFEFHQQRQSNFPSSSNVVGDVVIQSQQFFF